MTVAPASGPLHRLPLFPWDPTRVSSTPGVVQYRPSELAPSDGGGPVYESGWLLQEDGFAILTEDSGHLLWESVT